MAGIKLLDEPVSTKASGITPCTSDHSARRTSDAGTRTTYYDKSRNRSYNKHDHDCNHLSVRGDIRGRETQDERPAHHQNALPARHTGLNSLSHPLQPLSQGLFRSSYPIHPSAFLPQAPVPHPYTPAQPLLDMGFGPSPLFGWESVMPLQHTYGQPTYARRVKPDYRRFCFSVGKADVPYAALPGGSLWGYPTTMAPQLVGRW